jgi:uncharacterized protein (DUF302 family)
MRQWIAAAAMAVMGTQAAAEIIVKDATGTVAQATNRLEAVVRGAGAIVFARVDHGAGAGSVDMELADAQLLIFGNPMLGTPVMQQDIRAGLVLPLRVLVFDDAGQTRFAYEGLATMINGMDVEPDAAVLARISGALNNLTDKAMTP